MKVTKSDDLAIGKWVTKCCELDLTQIENEQELSDFLEYIEFSEPPFLLEVWDTKREALLEIRARYRPDIADNNDAISGIDAMLVNMEE